MPIDEMSLRKLLKVLYLPDAKRKSALREIIRNDISKENGEEAGGGDFHTPFWSDAKLHVRGQANLQQSTRDRIGLNARRKRLYPLLTNGFLKWWNEEVRWRNEKIEHIQANIKSHLELIEVGATIKIENFLTIGTHSGGHTHIYHILAKTLHF